MPDGSADIGKVVDRIRKLRRLATSPNEHEAARAREKALALEARYQIHVDDEPRPARMPRPARPAEGLSFVGNDLVFGESVQKEIDDILEDILEALQRPSPKRKARRRA